MEKNSGAIQRGDSPEIFKRADIERAFWEEGVFYMLSRGRGIVRFWTEGHPDMPSFAGKVKGAPQGERSEWSRRRVVQRVAEQKKQGETVKRQRASGCTEFVQDPAGGMYCRRCGFSAEEHPQV